MNEANAAHDVFVSYAHTDNEPENEDPHGWVERFGLQLELRLRKITGRKSVSVWRDAQMGRAELFDDAIAAALQGSRVMLTLISRSYLNSEYCLKEIELFREKAARESCGLTVGNTLRIFPVLLQNLPPAEWPEGVQGTSAFPLHNVGNPRLEQDRIGEPLEPATSEFGDAVQLLAEELSKTLDSIIQGESEPAGADGDSEAFKVFLSHPADDMGALSRRLARDLESSGIEVITNLPPPHEEPAHSEQVEAAVRASDLSIHLLGKSSGEAIDDDEDPGKTYPIEQARIGLEHAQSQLILQPEGLEIDLIEDPAYREFLLELDSRERDPKRLEIVRTNKHRILDVVLQKQAALTEARRQASLAQAGKTAFVDLSLLDLATAGDMVNYLTKQNVTPILAPSADPLPAMKVFAENLKRAEFYILYFGQVTRGWVESRLTAAQKLIWENDLQKKVGVYVAPPHKSASDIRFDPYPVAVNSGGFDPKTLELLLS